VLILTRSKPFTIRKNFYRLTVRLSLVHNDSLLVRDFDGDLITAIEFFFLLDLLDNVADESATQSLVDDFLVSSLLVGVGGGDVISLSLASVSTLTLGVLGLGALLIGSSGLGVTSLSRGLAL